MPRHISSPRSIVMVRRQRTGADSHRHARGQRLPALADTQRHAGADYPDREHDRRLVRGDAEVPRAASTSAAPPSRSRSTTPSRRREITVAYHVYPHLDRTQPALEPVISVPGGAG